MQRPYDYGDFDDPVSNGVVFAVLFAAAVGLGAVGWLCVRLLWR